MTDHRRFEQLVEDYPTTPVPQEKTFSGWRVGFVLAGVGIALPSLVSGAQFGSALGLEKAVLAFLAAAAFVSGLGFISGLVGSSTRLSTYMIIRFSFGDKGAHLVNIAFALSQFGWFGVNAYLFGDAAEAVGNDALGLALDSWIYILLGGILMTVSTIFGFKALDKLALFAVPLLMLALILMISRTFDIATWADLTAVQGAGNLSLSDAISALSGGIMVGVVLLPDLTRYSRSSWHTILAIVISLAIVEPLIHTSAAMPALAIGETEVLPILLAVGLGAYALAIMIFASWTSNAVNLYGSGLALTAVFPRFKEWRVIGFAGVVGTAIAFFDIPGLFVKFLYSQALIFTPVVGIYVTDFYLTRQRHYDLAAIAHEPPVNWNAYAAWAAGVAIAAAGAREIFSITGIPAFDAAMVAAAFYWLLGHFRPHHRRRSQPSEVTS